MLRIGFYQDLSKNKSGTHIVSVAFLLKTTNSYAHRITNYSISDLFLKET
jgi:hypothetical protein